MNCESNTLRWLVLALAFLPVSASFLPLRAQDPPAPPPGFVQLDDYWIQEEFVYGDAVFTATPWPNGVVPYVFAAAVSATNRDRMLNAMAEIEALCQVDFVPRTAETNYIRVDNASTNLSTSIGMGGGEQSIYIASWGTKYILVHELMHALGHLHEQQRPDRDNYVSIVSANVSNTCGLGGASSCLGNFTKINTATPVGPYDYLSILHYRDDAWGINGATTILALPPNQIYQNAMGNRTFMTAIDAAGLIGRYGAPSRPTITSIAPSIVLQGGSTVLTVSGTRFFGGSPNASGVQGTRVLINGTPSPTTYLNPNEVQVSIPVALTQNPGCIEIKVENSAPGGGISTGSQQLVVTSLAPTPGSFVGLFPGSQQGYAVATLGDTDGDGAIDIVLGEPGFNNGQGRIICYSGSTGLIRWTRQAPTSGERLGTSLSAYADINGDGVRDLLVGSPGFENDRGCVRIVNGATGSFVATFTGASAGDRYGTSVSEAGDVNNDGESDLIIGVPGRNNNTGQARVLTRNGTALHVFDGQAAGDQFGASVTGGFDLGGNGIADIAVGAPLNDTAASNAGRVYAYSGQSGALLFARNGDGSNDRFGGSVALVPSIDGTSSGTLLAGANEQGTPLGVGAGTGYVRLFSGWNGSAYPTIATLSGDAIGDRFGSSVARADDVNQDGYPDFVIGATQPSGTGYVRVFSGKDLSVLYTESGDAAGEYFGYSAIGGGDTDGDGAPDIVVGAPFSDLQCPNSGRAKVVHPRVPPSFHKVMITEVSWGNPDGVEITNFDSQPWNLSGWTIRWREGITRISAPLGITIASGGSILVKEPSGTYPEAPPSVPVLSLLPNIGTTSGDFTVALVNGAGIVVDEVRISDTAGQHNEGTLGGSFRGLALRGPSSLSGSVERIWGLDSNGGADWTEQVTRSMGLENLSSGPRGTDPLPVPAVVINEIDDSPDYVELRNRSGVTQNLRHWFLMASGVQEQAAVVVRPFPADRTISPTGFLVIGESATPPAELPGAFAPYVDLSAVGGGNLPFTTNEYTCALYDQYGRLVDLVTTTGHDDTVVHNDPRVPSAWNDFVGYGGRLPVGGGSIGRDSASTDTNRGSDWFPIAVRSMGLVNGAASLAGGPGLGDPLDVRVNDTGLGQGLAIIINGGPAQAGNTYGFVFSVGHLSGTGPVYGLGIEAIEHYINITSMPPWTGILDARGAARFDVGSGILPPGIDIDTIFFTLSPGGQFVALTGILEFDT